MPIPKSIITNILAQAIETKSRENVDEFVDIIYDNMQAGDIHKEKILRNESSIEKQHIEIMGILDAVKEGFKNVDKRFEDLIHYMDKRFDAVDKRFEDLIHHMDKRFEDLIHHMDKRFDDSNKRFDDVNKRFSLVTWLIGIGFVSVNILIVILKFFVQ